MRKNVLELASLGAVQQRPTCTSPGGFTAGARRGDVGEDAFGLKQAVQNVGLWVSVARVGTSLQKRSNVGEAALRLKQAVQKSDTNNFQHLIRECKHKWSRSNVHQHVQLNSKHNRIPSHVWSVVRDEAKQTGHHECDT